jgi:AraC-like DNA-binding protein
LTIRAIRRRIRQFKLTTEKPVNSEATHTTSFRVGSTFSLPEVIWSLGHSPDAVFAAASVDPTLYRHPENRILAKDLGRLFACAAQVTARRDISLLVTSSFRPPDLGLVGELAAEGPDVQTALKNLVRLLQYNTLAGYPTLSATEPMAILGFELRYSDFPGANFILEGAIGICLRFMQWLCGNLWKPEEVHLSGRKPQDPRPFRDFFGAPIRFSATNDAILFPSDWLKRPVAREQHRLDSSRLEIAAAPFSELVRRGVAMKLGFGSFGAKDLARQLSVSPRQFFRRLKAEGMTCQKIVDDVKFSRARHLLAAGDAPITEIALALGYPDHSSFTRAFARWSGVPPREWRRLVKAG